MTAAPPNVNVLDELNRQHRRNPINTAVRLTVNREAERAVIAALVRTEDPIRMIERLDLTADLFATDANREIFKAILTNASDKERAWLVQAIQARRPVNELRLIVDRLESIETRRSAQ